MMIHKTFKEILPGDIVFVLFPKRELKQCLILSVFDMRKKEDVSEYSFHASHNKWDEIIKDVELLQSETSGGKKIRARIAQEDIFENESVSPHEKEI